MSLLMHGFWVRNACPQTPVPYTLSGSIEKRDRVIRSTLSPVPATGLSQIEPGSARKTTVAIDLPL